MSKRIVGEDGKTYVQKKPFYKRVWFWILAIIIVILVGSSIGGQNKTSGAKKTSTAQSKKASKNKINVSQQTFDDLKVGDLASNGKGGTSYSDVIGKLGKPTTTSQSSVQGQTVEMSAWNNIGGAFTTISLSFGGEGDSRALSSKSITRAKDVLSSKKISQTDYDSITTDGTMKLDELINKFGNPSMTTVTSIMNTETKTIIWTNVNSSLGSSMSLTVSGGNTIIGKNKIN